jgi:hypothetical protein
VAARVEGMTDFYSKFVYHLKLAVAKAKGFGTPNRF